MIPSPAVPGFTATERRIAAQVAAALWVLTLAVLLLMAYWSTGSGALG